MSQSLPSRNARSVSNYLTTNKQLIDHCRTLIAGYKLPRRIRMLDDELPKNSSGKLDKRAMQLESTAEMPELSETWNKAAPTYLY